jgi:hypothetical protein
VGVDADPHRFRAFLLPLLTGLLPLGLSRLLGTALAERARLTKAALSGRARAWIAKAGLTRQARSRLPRHDLTRHARATRRAEAKARETGRRRQTLKRTRVLLVLARKALLSSDLSTPSGLLLSERARWYSRLPLSSLSSLSDLAESHLSHLSDPSLLGAVDEQPILVLFLTRNFVKRLLVARARDANDAAHARIGGSTSQSGLKTSSPRLARA